MLKEVLLFLGNLMDQLIPGTCKLLERNILALFYHGHWQSAKTQIIGDDEGINFIGFVHVTITLFKVRNLFRIHDKNLCAKCFESLVMMKKHGWMKTVNRRGLKPESECINSLTIHAF